MRLFEDDAQSVMIRFFDEDGIDVAEATQRKIERLYHREEFRRALASEIGDIEFPPRALELYTAAMMSAAIRTFTNPTLRTTACDCCP